MTSAATLWGNLKTPDWLRRIPQSEHWVHDRRRVTGRVRFEVAASKHCQAFHSRLIQYLYSIPTLFGDGSVIDEFPQSGANLNPRSTSSEITCSKRVDFPGNRRKHRAVRAASSRIARGRRAVIDYREGEAQVGRSHFGNLLLPFSNKICLRLIQADRNAVGRYGEK